MFWLGLLTGISIYVLCTVVVGIYAYFKKKKKLKEICDHLNQNTFK